jgi:CarD family transcriptional regulator
MSNLVMRLLKRAAAGMRRVWPGEHRNRAREDSRSQEATMGRFKVGDAVVHPLRGAGVVTAVEERELRGDSDEYYSIEMMGVPTTKLIVPTDAAEDVGLRRAISRSRLRRLWRVLKGEPDPLPTDHKKRYEQLRSKLSRGDTYEVAETVRDIAWREVEEGRLTTVDRRLYDEGMNLLAGEVAAVEGIEMSAAEKEIGARLSKGLASASPA